MLLLLLFTLVITGILAKDEVDFTGRYLDDLGERFESRNYGLAAPYSPLLHWSLAGLAMLTPQRITLTRDLPALYGAIWNKNPIQMRDWMAVVNFRITHSGSNHADGIAIWYSEKPGVGKAYGAPHNFSGIGVAFDTYSNSNKYIEKIYALFNRGNQEFNADDDGESLALNDNGGKISCTVPKNKLYVSANYPGNPKLLVRYFEETLSVYYAGPDDNTWIKCGSYDGLQLPLGYYFGVSAATGDLHSAHEIIGIKLFELSGKHDRDVSLTPLTAQSNKKIELDTEDAHRGLAPDSAWWTAFRVSVYSAFIAVVGMMGYFGYKEFIAPKRRMKKFY